MNIFDEQRPHKNNIKYLLTGGTLPALYLFPQDPETIKVMVFLQTRSPSHYKDFSTVMPLWRLKMWIDEWIDNPEFICERDFGYTGPTEMDTKLTLEKLGLLMSEDDH